MIVRKLEEIENTKRDVAWGNGRSRRFLVNSDNVPYSLTDTIVAAGTSSFLQYRNHIEACYCISGKGRVRAEETGEEFDISPGTLYALDKHDAHHLIAEEDEDLRLICVFSPGLAGNEIHDLSNSHNSSAY